MKKLIIFIVILLFPALLFAQDKSEIEITPHIIDEKGMASEIFTYTVMLKNNSDRLKNFYAFVNDLTIEDGRQEFSSPGKMDKTSSLARWVNIQRSVVDVKAGESVELPLKIQINQYAKPGKYYAKIVFGNGSNRPKAEENALSSNAPEIMININVEELIVEKSQMQQFKTTKNVYIKKPVIFTVDIENFGNRDVVPSGNIFITNRRGEEVDAIEFNLLSEKITPDEKKHFTIDWYSFNGYGKFKANAVLEYGDQESRDLQGTVTFWVLPLPLLIGFVLGLILLVILLTAIIYKKTYHPAREQAQLKENANNGVLDLKSK